MASQGWIIACDIGTSAVKTALFQFVEDRLLLDASATETYPTFMNKVGEAEQCVDDWWHAIGRGIRQCLSSRDLAPTSVEALIFTAQMQAMVPLGADGHALRNAMTYLDGRAVGMRHQGLEVGWPRIQTMNARLLLRSLRITGGIAASVKDPLWKYLWMKQYEPELFAQLDKWLDVKDYLTFRCTHQAVTTYDSAHLTWLYDVRSHREGWSRPLLNAYGVDSRHLPQVVQSGTFVGHLEPDAATDLGLVPGVAVYAGAGDVTTAAIGAGATAEGAAHLYIGTSGWLATSVRRPMVDTTHFVAAILGHEPPHFYYVAEQETAGACLEWIARQLRPELPHQEFFESLDRSLERRPEIHAPLFAPWLHGNRAPLSDAEARGVFFNLSITTTADDMARSVAEGLALHQRWMLDAIERRVRVTGPIRFVGGGAQSHAMAQLLADVMGRQVEVLSEPQHVGAMGAARLAARGLGWIARLDDFTPQPLLIVHPRDAYRTIYDRRYAVFQHLYRQNRRLFHDMQTS